MIIVLINFNNEINIKNLAQVAQLVFELKKTDINAQKIDKFIVKSFKIVIANFQNLNKLSPL